MKTLNEMLENQMQDEKFRKEYEEMQPEFDVISNCRCAYFSEFDSEGIVRTYRN